MNPPEPAAMCDGGDLDCGSGLLLIIRKAMNPLGPRQVLEVRSREISVKEDLPAWCRMVGHRIVGTESAPNNYTYYFIEKKGPDQELARDLDEARSFTWKTRVRWQEGLTARAFVRNHSFDIGQPASFDTEDEAPSAIEQLLASLAGCLVVGFQWRLSREQIEVFNLEMSLQGEVDNILVFLGVEEEGHPGLAKLKGSLYLDADGDPTRIEELWAETVARSPVASSLLRQVELDLELKRV